MQNFRIVSTPSDTRSALLEADRGVADTDLVAVAQRVIGDGRAVDRRAVRGSEIDDTETLGPAPYLGVVEGHLRVGERHRAVGEPTDRRFLVPERDPATVG